MWAYEGWGYIHDYEQHKEYFENELMKQHLTVLKDSEIEFIMEIPCGYKKTLEVQKNHQTLHKVANLFNRCSACQFLINFTSTLKTPCSFLNDI